MFRFVYVFEANTHFLMDATIKMSDKYYFNYYANI